MRRMRQTLDPDRRVYRTTLSPQLTRDCLRHRKGRLESGPSEAGADDRGCRKGLVLILRDAEGRDSLHLESLFEVLQGVRPDPDLGLEDDKRNRMIPCAVRRVEKWHIEDTLMIDIFTS